MPAGLRGPRGAARGASVARLQSPRSSEIAISSDAPPAHTHTRYTRMYVRVVGVARWRNGDGGGLARSLSRSLSRSGARCATRLGGALELAGSSTWTSSTWTSSTRTCELMHARSSCPCVLSRTPRIDGTPRHVVSRTLTELGLKPLGTKQFGWGKQFGPLVMFDYFVMFA